MRFRIFRYDPDKDEKPRMQEYDVALDPHDRMLLDARCASRSTTTV